MKMKIKKQIKWQELITYIVLIILLSIAVFSLFIGIRLKKENEELIAVLKEYEELEIEIKKLTTLKEKYNIIQINNEELTSRKKDLEEKKNELNNEIDNLKSKVNKLK